MPMNVRTIAWSFCLAAFCLIPNLSGAADPFDGTWKLNVAKSKYVPGPGPQSMTVTVKVEGDTHSVKSKGKAPNGIEIEESFVAKLDGTPAPVAGSPEIDIIAVRKTGERTLLAKASKEGKPVGAQRVTVSPDGKSLTINGTGVDSKGAKQKWSEVYDKQ
jgi:hypothetical protein